MDKNLGCFCSLSLPRPICCCFQSNKWGVPQACVALPSFKPSAVEFMIERIFGRCFSALLVVNFLNLAICFANGQGTNGIFADFTTSKGNFTCWLDYTNAPRTVANFISLATGERAWLDWQNGQIRTNPFYSGQIFHRVITNFIIQGGSPNGQGTDGPGYVVLDEFSPNLRHNLCPWPTQVRTLGVPSFSLL